MVNMKFIGYCATLKNSFAVDLTDNEEKYSFLFPLNLTQDPTTQTGLFRSSTKDVKPELSPNFLFFPAEGSHKPRNDDDSSFLLREILLTMRPSTGNDNYSVHSFFRDVEKKIIFIPHVSE
ncbi:hypothetical protein TNCV_2979461 [Trichonephila clavipes]|nr:hypothetical protein TNCV_2979461 [Trichonephila clavipes]